MPRIDSELEVFFHRAPLRLARVPAPRAAATGWTRTDTKTSITFTANLSNNQRVTSVAVEGRKIIATGATPGPCSWRMEGCRAVTVKGPAISFTKTLILPAEADETPLQTNIDADGNLRVTVNKRGVAAMKTTSVRHVVLSTEVVGMTE
jgi:hypothetical protein